MSTISKARSAGKPRSAGFTLVELLVVIAIIGVLAGLITTAVYAALVYAKEMTIKVEIDQMATALNQYKAEYNSFPPDFSDTNLVAQHCRDRWPRITAAEVTAIQNLGLNRAQALVFWLRGFSGSPTNPHTATGARVSMYGFEPARLVDPNTNAPPAVGATTVPVYIPQNGGRAGDGSIRPFIYYEARNYANTTFGSQRPYLSDLPTEVYVNPDGFQLVHCGLDGDWGQTATGSGAPKYPSGTNYLKSDRDNITSFNKKGTTLEDSIP